MSETNKTRRFPKIVRDHLLANLRPDPTPVRSLNTSNAQRRSMQTAEAAKYLGVSASLLRKWRMKAPDDPGTHGPRFLRISEQLVLYDIKDLDAWVESFK